MAKVHISIRWKVLILILAVISLVIFSIAFVISKQQSESLTHLLQQNAASKAKDIRFYAARAILERNDLGIVDSLKNASKIPGFTYAAVLRADTKKAISSRYAFQERNDSLKNNYKEKFEVIWEKQLFSIWKKFKKGKKKYRKLIIDQVIHPQNVKHNLFIFHLAIYHPFVKIKKAPLLGLVQIAFSDEFIQNEIQKGRNQVFIGVIVFFFIGSIAALFLASFIVKPISILSKGANEVGAGNLDYKVPDLGNDELGVLARQFNKMTSGLKNAQQAKEERLILNEQIRQATEIQEGMNPSHFIDEQEYQVKGYTRAAKGVGGDYFDFQILKDNRLAVLISDVSGKSISASLVMVLIKTVVATYMNLFNSVRGDKIVTAINRIMCSQTHIDKFATFFYCIYDPQTKLLDFTNGGHGPIFIYRAANKVCTLTKLEGLPVGIDEDNIYKLAQVSLGSGDIVVLFTDGVNEAWDIDKNEFGLVRLRKKVMEYAHLNAKEIVSNIIRDIDDFTKSAEQHDDISLVIFKIP